MLQLFVKSVIIRFRKYNALSHFCKYPSPTTYKHTTFANQGRDIYQSVIKGYLMFPHQL
jgi:hypothetical protein